MSARPASPRMAFSADVERVRNDTWFAVLMVLLSLIIGLDAPTPARIVILGFLTLPLLLILARRVRSWRVARRAPALVIEGTTLEWSPDGTPGRNVRVDVRALREKPEQPSWFTVVDASGRSFAFDLAWVAPSERERALEELRRLASELAAREDVEALPDGWDAWPTTTVSRGVRVASRGAALGLIVGGILLWRAAGVSVVEESPRFLADAAALCMGGAIGLLAPARKGVSMVAAVGAVVAILASVLAMFWFGDAVAFRLESAAAAFVAILVIPVLREVAFVVSRRRRWERRLEGSRAAGG